MAVVPRAACVMRVCVRPLCRVLRVACPVRHPPFPERPLPQGTERKRGLMRGMEQMLTDQETKKKNQTVGAAFYAMQAAHAARDKWGAFPGDGRTSLATPDCACPQCTPPPSLALLE